MPILPGWNRHCHQNGTRNHCLHLWCGDSSSWVSTVRASQWPFWFSICLTEIQKYSELNLQVHSTISCGYTHLYSWKECFSHSYVVIFKSAFWSSFIWCGTCLSVVFPHPCNKYFSQNSESWGCWNGRVMSGFSICHAVIFQKAVGMTDMSLITVEGLLHFGCMTSAISSVLIGDTGLQSTTFL